MSLKAKSARRNRFIYLNHTADAKFQAFGRNLEEAFANAALAVASLMWEPANIKKRQRRTVLVQGKDLEQLLFKFLSEILYLLEAKGFMLAQCRDIKILQGENGYSLQAVFEGDNRNNNYAIFSEVKAITYHDMIIRQDKEVLIQVVVDM